MGRVPKKYRYLLVGSGRLAKHLKYFLNHKNLDLVFWSRGGQKEFNSLSKADLASLKTLAHSADYILLAISDKSLSSFVDHHSFLLEKKIVHFSGALELDEMISLHPLMTFTDVLYDISFYNEIPFVGSLGRPQFSDVFVELDNPVIAIRPDLKPLYHALCVLSGNFANILWKQSLELYRSELNIDIELLAPYLKQTLANFLNNPQDSLTGPLARKDYETINNNLAALTKFGLNNFYQSFVELNNKTSGSPKKELSC